MLIDHTKREVIYDPQTFEHAMAAIESCIGAVNVKRSGAVLPAGQICPTAKPYSTDPNAKPVDLIPEANWTEAMKNIAAYAVFLAVRNGAVDARAPAVAAALFAVAELGFWSLERSPSRSERVVLLRRVSGLAAGAILTALVGTLVLVLATGASGGVGLEAAGVAAAVLAVAAITRLASRASV